MSNGEAQQGEVASRLSLVEQAQEVSKRLDEAGSLLYRVIDEIERVCGRCEARDTQIKTVSFSPGTFTVDLPIAAVPSVEDPLHVIARAISGVIIELQSGPQPISVAQAIRVLGRIEASLRGGARLDVQA